MSVAREYLQSQLASLIDASSLDTTVEYLSSFEDLTSSASRDDMVLFLEGAFGYKERFSVIIEEYIRQRHEKEHNIPQKKLNASAEQFQPKHSGRSLTNRTTNNANRTTKSEVRKHVPKVGPRAEGKKVKTTSSVCGCMATHHPFFASCIACGRIYCSNEQDYGCCMVCGTGLLEEVSYIARSSHSPMPNDQDACEKAYAQKDKLLLFDKECAKRTQVFDAQGDYYETGTWLSDDEKHYMDEQERKRLEKARRKPKSRMAVSFDMAGRKTVEYMNEEDNEGISSDNNNNGPEISYDEETHFEFELENTSLLASDSSILGRNKAAAMYNLLRERIVKGTHSPDISETKENTSFSHTSPKGNTIIVSESDNLERVEGSQQRKDSSNIPRKQQSRHKKNKGKLQQSSP